MDLHFSLSSAHRTHSLYFISFHLKMSFSYVVLRAPLRLTPSTFPSSRMRCSPRALIKCPKYTAFLCLTVFNIHRSLPTLLKTSLSRVSEVLSTCTSLSRVGEVLSTCTSLSRVGEVLSTCTSLSRVLNTMRQRKAVQASTKY